MFGYAANRLEAVECAGGAAWAVRRVAHYFQRGRATIETRDISMENASRAHPSPPQSSTMTLLSH